jgi:hypothetical protein
LHARPKRSHFHVPTPQVTAFSRWERELPKLLGDARFSAVATTKDRRALFDEYCKEIGVAARRGCQPVKGAFK